jgi:hypothetical protein
MTNPNDSAFSKSGFYDPYNSYVSGEEGLTKREYFAAMAMQGILNSEFLDIKRFAKLAVEAADALIAELNK